MANIEEKPIDTAIKVYYYHNDHLGSPRAMTDKNSRIVWRQDYYPFGGAIWTQTGTYKSSLTFSSKELDDTGLFYFGARYYEPGMGRFITPDPVDVPGRNLYVYCYNNPLIYADPNGEFAWFAAFLIGGFVSAGITYCDTGKFSLESFVIGGLMSAMTYGIAFAGAEAGAGSALAAEAIASNRVLASGFTQLIMSSDAMQALTGDNFLTSVAVSAFIQSGIETGLSWDKNVSVVSVDKEHIKGNVDKIGVQRQTKGFIEAGGHGRRRLGDTGMHDFKKVSRGNNNLGYVSHGNIGKTPAIHTAAAGKVPFTSKFRYAIDGVCHQDVGRTLGIAPTQLFTNQIDVWLTMGVYGTTGGSGALPAYLLIQYNQYRQEREK